MNGLHAKTRISVCGEVSGAIVVLDVDTSEGKEGQDSLDDLCWQNDDLPHTWSQRTGSGGAQYFFKVPVYLDMPRNSQSRVGKNLDVRGEGGFVVLPPSTHPCGELYSWMPGCAPHECDLAELPQWLHALMVQNTDTPERRAVIESNQERDYMGRATDGRDSIAAHTAYWACEEYARLHGHITENSLDAVLELAWPKYKAQVGPKQIGSSLDAEGRGSDFLARKIRYLLSTERKRSQINSDAERDRQITPEQPVAAPALAAGDLVLRAIGDLDPKKIPQRQFLFGEFLLRRYLSVLISPPGIGKTTLIIQVAIALAVNQAFADWNVHEAGNVLIINNEDDEDEILRRIAAVCISANIDFKAVRGRLHIISNAEDNPLFVAHTDPQNGVVLTPHSALLEQYIVSNHIIATFVDPFAETHGVNENSNDEIKVVGRIYRQIAKRTNSAVCVVHHTRKVPGGSSEGHAGNMDSGRGAGALNGVARVVSTLYSMSDKDARKLGIEEDQAYKYIRFDDAKANLTLVSGNAKWFERVGVPLNNGPALNPSAGDVIGVLKPADFTQSIQAEKARIQERNVQIATQVAQWILENKNLNLSEATRRYLEKPDWKLKEKQTRNAILSAIPEASNNPPDVTIRDTKFRLWHRKESASKTAKISFVLSEVK